MDRRLPDTPWHVGYTKKKEEDPRRHKARCIHRRESKCTYSKSPCIGTKCPGSAHCKFYAESEEQWKEVYQKTRTIEEETLDNMKKYYQGLQGKKEKALKKFNSPFQYQLVRDLRFCPVCNNKLVGEHYGNRVYCRYCTSLFINEGKVREDDKDYFIVGKKERRRKSNIFQPVFILEIRENVHITICHK